MTNEQQPADQCPAISTGHYMSNCGPNGEIQCRYCGESPPDKPADPALIGEGTLPTWLLILIGNYGSSSKNDNDVEKLYRWELLMDGIKAYAKEAAIAALSQPKGDVLAALQNPETVHVMMLRGKIAIPSWRNFVDLRGEVPNGEDVQLSRIAELQEQNAALSLPRQSEAVADYQLLRQVYAVLQRYDGDDDDFRTVCNRVFAVLSLSQSGAVAPRGDVVESLEQIITARYSLNSEQLPADVVGVLDMAVRALSTPQPAQGDAELAAWRELSLACSMPGAIVWPNSWPQDVAIVAHLIWTLQTKLDTTPAAHGVGDGMVVVPREVKDLYDFMVMAFAPFTSQQEQIAISLKKAKAAVKKAASAPGGGNESVACESGSAACGSVEHYDDDGVPLCQRCWDAL